MLLKPETRKIYLDLGYGAKACNKLKNDNRDDEFLVSRIIFLTTYDPSVDLEKMIDQHHLAEHICLNIGRFAKQYTTKQKSVKELDPMENMALVESLKLLFNVTHFCPQRTGAFSPALPSILVILNKRPIMASKPLEAPTNSLVNALLNLNLAGRENVERMFPKVAPNVNLDRLLDILDKATKIYVDDELEGMVSPLLALLRKLYEIAPEEIKSYMKGQLLPSDADRKQPLGRAETLSARLLRLSSGATTPQIRESISTLLFDLSDQDATMMVQNIGYGFASGFLFSHNVPIPENALEAWSTSDSNASNPKASIESSKSFNPITGQHLDAEPVVEVPNMTQAEKEREAERLYVLFERYLHLVLFGIVTLTSVIRLRQTGVMNVENPVATAMREGRFVDVDDDDSD